MEQQPQPTGGEPAPANSYGTDDPATQAEIEAARTAASQERRRDRVRLEHYVESGLAPDDAESLIEFQHHIHDRAVTGQQHETDEPRYRPRIYVADLASQEQGIQHGAWIDANQDAPGLDTAITAMLDQSPVGNPWTWASAWAVQQAEDFAELTVTGLTDTALIARLAHGVATFGAAYAVYVEHVGHDIHELNRFEDHYLGSYDSPEAWARESARDLEWDQRLAAIADPLLRHYLYVDYRRFAEDWLPHWDSGWGMDGKLHVFLR